MNTQRSESDVPEALGGAGPHGHRGPDGALRAQPAPGAGLEILSIVAVVLGLLLVVVFALTNHPHRAVLAVCALLFALAGMRAVWPGRPWFASRWRWMDVVFYAAIGAAIWFFSPFTATMGIV